MTEHRWTKFWWQDWQRDPALRMCSPGARGVWMDMLAICSDAHPKGHLLVNNRPPTVRQLASVFGCSENQARSYIKELEEAGVFSRTDEAVIYNRRMVRDNAVSEKAREDGKRGGNPSLKSSKTPLDNGGGNGGGITSGDNPPPNLLEAEAEAEAEAERNTPSLRSVPLGASEARGSRLPEDWQPDDVGRKFAASLNLDPGAVAAKFRDYWHAKPGKDGRKSDWHATWRNWCRSEAERRTSRPSPFDARKAASDAALATQLSRIASLEAEPEPFRQPSLGGFVQ